MAAHNVASRRRCRGRPRRAQRSIGLLLVVAAVVTGCRSTGTPSAPGSVADGRVPLDRTLSSSLSVLELAATTATLTTFHSVVLAGATAEALDQEGPLTVFVPTDDAFDRSLRAAGLTLDQILADAAVARAVVSAHVLDGRTLSTELSDGATGVAWSGDEITATLLGGPRVNGKAIVSPDIVVSNGVVHTVDAVLWPQAVIPREGATAQSVADAAAAVIVRPSDVRDGGAPAGRQRLGSLGGNSSVMDIVAARPDLTLLFDAIVAAGLDDELRAPGPFTLLAPTNTAFATLLRDAGLTRDELLAQRPLVEQVLVHHVLSAEILGNEAVLLAGRSVTTAGGSRLPVTVSQGQIAIGGAGVVEADLQAGNGVVWVLDAVLLAS